MIEKELLFNYNNNYRYIFDITTNNNEEILKILDDLKEYKQGVWKNNKRKDFIEFKINDIPDILKTITSSIIVDNNLPLKLKIKLIEDSENKIIMKIKANLINKVANLLLKILNLKVITTIENNNNISSKVKIKYIIKSILPSSIIDIIDKYIETKLNNNFIAKIDKYLKQLEK